jgi:hypothetical protein
MKKFLRVIALSAVWAAPFSVAFGAGQDAAASNAAMDKFKEDIKAAVMNGSLTVMQVKELHENLEVLKESKSQPPGSPIDLVTPYGAVNKIRAIMATVKQPDRDTLARDFKLVVASKQPPPSAEPETPGKKLGKDIFMAVMRGQPTVPQVEQLQQSLNSLASLKSSGGGKLQEFRALKQAKSQISQTMNAGAFQPEDRQAVLDDLNNLGPGGGRGRG